jgi:hypothetical protein
VGAAAEAWRVERENQEEGAHCYNGAMQKTIAVRNGTVIETFELLAAHHLQVARGARLRGWPSGAAI